MDKKFSLSLPLICIKIIWNKTVEPLISYIIIWLGDKEVLCQFEVIFLLFVRRKLPKHKTKTIMVLHS
ncbi:hypothetical protein G3A_02925 [Bacillus sp. 17376]|nr:hypothetical protein G3A_02925 [Bacillus sp. 17376]